MDAERHHIYCATESLSTSLEIDQQVWVAIHSRVATHIHPDSGYIELDSTSEVLQLEDESIVRLQCLFRSNEWMRHPWSRADSCFARQNARAFS